MVNENNFKFLSPPTIEQIDAAVKRAGVSEAQFERYYGLYKRCICHVRSGFKQMPSKYWHLFLEDNHVVTRTVTKKARHNVPQRSGFRVKKTSTVSKLL